MAVLRMTYKYYKLLFRKIEEYWNHSSDTRKDYEIRVRWSVLTKFKAVMDVAEETAVLLPVNP
jgi:hypothetical protein